MDKNDGSLPKPGSLRLYGRSREAKKRGLDEKNQAYKRRQTIKKGSAPG
jgi:hypothetical protein